MAGFGKGGKGGKGIGKVGIKRNQKKSNKSIIEGITKPAIRRLARRAGIKRIASTVYPESRTMLENFITSVVQGAIIYTQHQNKKTVSAMDVVRSLKRHGRTLYGYSA